MKTIDERFNLKDKIAVVIGGAGFLCSALGRALEESGVKVCILDMHDRIPPERADYPHTYLKCNATAKADVVRCHAEVLRLHGRVDILLNGAGTNAPTPFMEIEAEEMDRILQSHIHATLFACQIFGQTMLHQKSGSIINFASASSGPPLSKAFVYSMAKAGISSITQNLAREWGTTGVRVNALRPGFFPTEWSMKNFIDESRQSKILGHTPMGRFGTPEELVGAVLWLASDAASFVTGSIVAIDGGFTCMTI
jgi:NAD(P)-dependent dehydrogenase (short-subunit alcohol dehydrogenase family)